MIASNSMQTLNRLPSLSIRATTFVLILMAGMMGTSVYASDAAGKSNPAVAKASPNNQESPNKSGDISERVEFVDKIKFAPCPENPTLECGTLTLPVDYHQLHGETFGLAVIRARATNPEKRIGVLFGNAGGPGGSGVDFVLGGVSANAPAFIRLRERFDIVSFDVRGSHRSRAVRCEIEPAGDPTKVGEADLVTFFDDFSRRVAQACLEQNGPFILSLSHNNIARDMNMVRRALGEQRITYVGYSFGTELGAIYTSLFPQHVRAALLDSGIPPEFRDQRVEFRSEQGASFESVLHRLDQLCRKDTACRLHDTGVITTFDEVIAQLKAAPATSPSGLVLESGHVANMISPFLSIESFWPLIIDGLAEARGGNYSLFFQFLPSPSGVPFLSTSTLDAFTAIQCNDFGTRRSAAEYLPVDEVAGALTPRMDGRFRVAAATAVCASWPKTEEPIIHNVKKQIANPILIIGNDFDPNTPLSWTRRLARALGMERSVVRYQGGGHLAYAVRGNACIDRVGDAYLFDLTIPDEGFVCPAQPIRFRRSAAQAEADSKRAIDAIKRDLLQGQPMPVRQK